ncbi:MAG: hydroxyisourate hydrolase [Alphaproteobacteria bacterium]
MGRLTTHVLDTARGIPAAGVTIDLYRCDGDRTEHVKKTSTNADGRCDAPLLEDAELTAGVYELVFHAGDYFRAGGVALSDPPFLDLIPIRFSVADAGAHYHVPLLLSPWSYSTYRGS